MSNYINTYKRWLNSEKVDEQTKEQLISIKDNDEEIKYRFISYLSFGTAGLRGTMVAGTNAMNVYTVAHATQGFANLINKEKKADMGIVIAYDSRNNSEHFAKIAASVMAANGIKAYVFESIRPTPVLSFSIRELQCIAGINITASHNPKEYNGYKAYWEDGAQLSLEQAETVSDFIKATDIFDDVKTCCFDSAVKDNKIIMVGKDLDEKYLQAILSQQVNSSIVKSVADELKIVYTPLHGSGYKLIPEVLKRIGLKYLYPVEEQMIIDGDFPTVAFPNPEYPAVFELGIKLAESVQSDLIIATDPDADRVGIMVRDDSGKFITLTGNQVGALLLHYIVSALEESNSIPENPYVIKTIVTTELITKICKVHNLKLHNVLTGFKFIGEAIKKYEVTGHDNYIFGFEESYGYLRGTYARDKDAVVASMLLCEMAAYYKSKDMTIYDALKSMYVEYGYYADGVDNIYMEGLDGLEKMQLLMSKLRENPPKEIGGKKVISVRDYQSETITNIITGNVSSTGLPKSNVLYYETETNDVIVIRPSGTEPKIKIYFLVHGVNKTLADETIASYKSIVAEWTKEL